MSHPKENEGIELPTKPSDLCLNQTSKPDKNSLEQIDANANNKAIEDVIARAGKQFPEIPKIELKKEAEDSFEEKYEERKKDLQNTGGGIRHSYYEA